MVPCILRTLHYCRSFFEFNSCGNRQSRRERANPRFDVAQEEGPDEWHCVPYYNREGAWFKALFQAGNIGIAHKGFHHFIVPFDGEMQWKLYGGMGGCNACEQCTNKYVIASPSLCVATSSSYKIRICSCSPAVAFYQYCLGAGYGLPVR